ncbi:MAG TPA: DUF4058 family protein [Armatimonadota bacterium]|nr:DUF4058 family protein [Armatimonadota bacterium]
MPSPFPGMDPYLEGPLWMTVHTQLSAEIARQLAPKLRPRYLALTTERIVMEIPRGVSIATASLYPDVGVASVATWSGPSVATAPLQVATPMPVPVPHVTVEIRDVANRQLVTAIEVLSPSNKRGEGREEYLAKRGRLLLSTAHLLEIDLLREGQRVPLLEPLPPAPYFVFLSRAERRPILDVWPIQLSASLPTVAVPLLPDDPDVVLDLQLALSTVYDLVGYDLAVDYSQPPPVPLSAEEASRARQWIDAHRAFGSS